MASNLTCLNNLSIYTLCFHNQAGDGFEVEYINNTPPINILTIGINSNFMFSDWLDIYANKYFV